MAIKVIAQRREVKLGKNPGMKFVMRPDLYIPIAEKKVFSEASTHSGISAGVIKAAWDAAGEVIRTWAHGFKPLDSEWWHFTLKDEPFPDTYFTFPVKQLN